MKSKHKGFKDEFNSLPANKKNVFLLAVRDEMGWSTVTFYAKCRGDRGMSKAEETVLRGLFAGFGIEY